MTLFLPLSKFQSRTTELIITDHLVERVYHPGRIVGIKPPTKKKEYYFMLM